MITQAEIDKKVMAALRRAPVSVWGIPVWSTIVMGGTTARVYPAWAEETRLVASRLPVRLQGAVGDG